MRWLIALVVLTFATLSAEAQIEVQVNLVPEMPIAGQTFTVQFRSIALFDFRSVTRTGNHIVFDFYGCHITCIDDPINVPMTLPEGTYSYEITIGSTVLDTGSFAVAAAHEPVPALSPWMLGALAAALMTVGWFWLGRH